MGTVYIEDHSNTCIVLHAVVGHYTPVVKMIQIHKAVALLVSSVLMHHVTYLMWFYLV